MNEKAHFDALVTETKAHAEALNWEAGRPRAQPREAVERIGLNPLDFGGSEHDEIRKRVENFRKHQERFSREREEYASSILRILRIVNPVAK